jgi:hypothetical protein
LLKAFTAGKAGVIQAHHILEQRFLKLWGYSVAEAPAQILTQAEHETLSKVAFGGVTTAVAASAAVGSEVGQISRDLGWVYRWP